MKLKEFDIKLDIKESTQLPHFEVVVGDYDSNILNISLYDTDNVYPLAGLDVEIAFAKPDRTTVVQDKSNGVVIDGDSIRCTLASNTIAVSGTVYAEVRVLQDTKVLTSSKFRFYVRNPILNDKTIESSNEYPMLVRALEDAKGASEALPEINAAIGNIRDAESELNQSIGQASALDDTLNGTIQSAEQVKDALCGSIETAGTAKTQLDDSISSASTSKSELDNSIAQAGTAKNELDGSIAQAGTVKGELDSSIATAGQTKTALDESIATGELAEFKDDFTSHLNDYATYKDSTTLKVAKVERELNDYKATMQQVNINQEPKQKVSGYGTVSLPKNAANGQVSLTIKGNTEVDEEGNTKSTVGAMRLKPIGKNLVRNGSGEEGIKYWNSVTANSFIFNGEYFEKVAGVGNTVYSDWLKLPAGQWRLSSFGQSLIGASYQIDLLDTYGTSLGTYWPSTELRQMGVTITLTEPKTVRIRLLTGAMANRFIIRQVQLERGDTATEYEPYTESNAYVVAKDGDKIVDLKSLPNGVKDEVRLGEGRAIIRTKKKILEASDIISLVTTNTNNDVLFVKKPTDYIGYNNVQSLLGSVSMPRFTMTWKDFVDMEGNINNIHNNQTVDRFLITAPKGKYLTLVDARADLAGTPLTYQLATPIEIPIEVSGTLLSYPSGTVYIEPVVADAGIYDNGINVLHQDLPIDYIERLSKVDFMTGAETPIDVSQCVISEDKLSFTHPDLVSGDIVFFTYFYDRESTIGETTVEYYDSRYTIKDSVTDKFYKWNVTVTDGVPSIELVEV